MINNEEYNDDKCAEKIKEQNEEYIPCTNISPNMKHHCSSFQVTTAYHEACMKAYVYFPIQTWYCMNMKTEDVRYFPQSSIMKECMKLAKKDPDWTCDTCYCCCACFANTTKIETETGLKEVRYIETGENIKVGTLKKEGTSSCDWDLKSVTFSSGTKTDRQEGMVYVVFGDNKDIVVSSDHVFLLSDRKFVTADKLMPGDSLVDAEGNSIPILTASLGRYEGGIHHISTDTSFNGNPNGHLIISEGIVSGDYTLQLNFNKLSNEYKTENYDNRIMIGSHEFLKKYRKHNIKSVSYFSQPDNLEKLSEPHFFKAYSLNNTSYEAFNPFYINASKFVNDEQSIDIFNNSTMLPMSATIRHGMAEYAISFLSGFYPNIKLVLDWRCLEPNVYSFKMFEQKYVVLSGAFARIKGISLETIIFAISQGIARFYGEEFEENDKMCSMGKADFYASAVISRNTFYPTIWSSIVKTVVKDIEKIFSCIESENDNDNPKIECRIDTIYAGFGGENFPECAGGVKPVPLEVERVIADKNSIKLICNLDLIKDIAEDISNYNINNGAIIKKVKLNNNKQFQIEIEAQLEENIEYYLNVKDLVSLKNTRLPNNNQTLKFKQNI